MTPNSEYWVEVDEQGRLVLPAEVAEHLGIQPGAQMLLKEGSKGLHLQRPITHMAKVYVEPTSRCNLTCRTCIRNAWKEPQGDMSAETWNRIIESLKELPSRPDVFFGGFGEPLLLTNIAEMVTQAKAFAKRRVDHQRYIVDRGTLPGTDRGGPGYLVDFGGWRNTGELCRCSPRSRFAAGSRKY